MKWVFVKKLHRCTHCGHMVNATWRWQVNSTTSTHALCEDCADALLAEAA